MKAGQRAGAKPSTRESILAAAVEEFVLHGLSGARLEHVAARAGCNKALVYRHFGDRDNLFREALKSQFEHRAALLDTLPQTLPELLDWWSRATLRDERFVRMILRESLDYAGGEPVESGSREEYYRRQVAMIDAMKAEGRIAKDFDAQVLFLALLGVISLPAVMPQIASLVTGLEVDSPEFLARWRTGMETLASRLAPRSED